jgi:hypothetical protein
MRRLASVLFLITFLLGLGLTASPALAVVNITEPTGYVYPSQKAAHQEVEFVWDSTNDCNNSIRLRLVAGVRNATSSAVFVEYIRVRYLPRTHTIQGGLLEVYGAAPGQTFVANDVHDGTIPTGVVTERRFTVNRTMSLDDGLSLQVDKEIHPNLIIEDTCRFGYRMVARFAAHKEQCADFTHGARKVSVCVRLFRAGREWWAEGGMATNSGAVTMRMSLLRLIIDGVTRASAPEVVQTGGSFRRQTPRFTESTVPAGRPVSATMGYRMTWGDGTCYPECSPPNSAFIAATSTTR